MTRRESRKVQVSMGVGAERAEQNTAEGDAEYVRRSLNASDPCMASFSHAETRSFRHSDSRRTLLLIASAQFRDPQSMPEISRPPVGS